MSDIIKTFDNKDGIFEGLLTKEEIITPIEITKEKDEAYWVKYIKGRIEKNKNFLGFIGGQTGSGKTYAGIEICRQLSPDFTPDDIFFGFRPLMQRVNEDKLKAGHPILFDEAGIDISSKTWQSLTNRMINFLLQTFRHKRLILIFTSPYLDFIDASTRKLFHAEFITERINYTNETCMLKPQLIQYNAKLRKFYYKYLRVAIPKRGVLPLKAWNIPKPPQWMIDEYEKKKKEFTKKLNKDILKQLDDLETKKDPNYRKPLTPLQQKCMELIAKYNDINQVAAEIGISIKTAYFHISQAHKKGYANSEFTIENILKKGDGV